MGILTSVVLWFMTRFESSGTHGCDEQWNMRDMRVYIGSGLLEDNSPVRRPSYFTLHCFLESHIMFV
jgi:hypothetical protein